MAASTGARCSTTCRMSRSARWPSRLPIRTWCMWGWGKATTARAHRSVTACGAPPMAANTGRTLASKRPSRSSAWWWTRPIRRSPSWRRAATCSDRIRNAACTARWMAARPGRTSSSSIMTRASRDNGNAAMPKIEQMPGRVTHAFSVVGHHRIRPARQVAINQYDWNIQPAEEGIELFRNRRERPDNNSIRPAAAKPRKEFPLAFAATFRIRKQQGKTRFVQDVVRRPDEGCQSREVDFANHATDGMGGFDAHALRHRVWRVAQILDCRLDLIPKDGSNLGVPVEDARYSPDRNTGGAGDIHDRKSRNAFHLS